MLQSKILARTLTLPIAFTIAFSGGGVAVAQDATSATSASISAHGVSTDHITTPDGTAAVTEDFEAGTITVTDENGETVVFDRNEILGMAAQIPTTTVQKDGRMMATAAADSGTRAYLCNLFAGVAAGAQSWAWQTALAIAKVHPGVRAITAGGQIAFWAFITTQC